MRPSEESAPERAPVPDGELSPTLSSACPPDPSDQRLSEVVVSPLSSLMQIHADMLVICANICSAVWCATRWMVISEANRSVPPVESRRS